MTDLRKDTPNIAEPTNGWGQGLWFVICCTIGMGAIAASLLSQPVSRYYADQRALQLQQERFDSLQRIYDQQKELLANTDNPLVIERVAVNCLQYRPALVAAAGPGPTLPELPDYMKTAVRQVRQKKLPPPSSLQRWADALAARSEARSMLLLLGAGLVLIAMSCFYRRN
ncbi:MAG: hypothetical protein JW709_07525 [Sedimentisphaerales bacterium]|nr:hypothetical protein [Sedimentisphaerales bacterium]